MIIAQTKLKKIPDQCLKCKFCIDIDRLAHKTIKENRYIVEYYRQKKCFITGIEVPYIFNKSKHRETYAFLYKYN